MSINIMVRLKPTKKVSYINCLDNVLNVKDIKKDILSNEKVINREFIFVIINNIIFFWFLSCSYYNIINIKYFFYFFFRIFFRNVNM